MKVIALVPVRNEAWILPHALACFSGFCDHVIVSDQASTDISRALCAAFPKVTVIDRTPSTDRAMAASRRWQLLDAARDYDGNNLLFSIDPDELISPALVRAWLSVSSTRLKPRTFFRCGYYQLWNSAATYRDDDSPYQPQFKLMAFVDDRCVDFERLPATAVLHEARVPEVEDAVTAEEPGLPVLHLQWLLPEYNQVKQAWYRCRELIDGRQTATELNEFYAITLPSPDAHTAPVPHTWLEEISLPDFAAVDRQPAWHLTEILSWFDQLGIDYFEPLEIWHISRLRDEFHRRVGRDPQPDRSYVAGWHERAHRAARRAAGAAWRRMFT